MTRLTDDDLALVRHHILCHSFVSSETATQLLDEVSSLRAENARLQGNFDTLSSEYDRDVSAPTIASVFAHSLTAEEREVLYAIRKFISHSLFEYDITLPAPLALLDRLLKETP